MQSCNREVEFVAPNATIESLLTRYDWWSILLNDTRTQLFLTAKADTRTRDMLVR
jgi:hypothetical protein